MNTKTRATLSYVHLQESDTPDYGLPWLYNTVAPGPIGITITDFPNENYLKTNDDILTLKVEHEFSPNRESAHHCAGGELSAAGADYGAADLLECAGERAGGWDCGVAADVGGESDAAVPLYGCEQSEHDSR